MTFLFMAELIKTQMASASLAFSVLFSSNFSSKKETSAPAKDSVKNSPFHNYFFREAK